MSFSVAKETIVVKRPVYDYNSYRRSYSVVDLDKVNLFAESKKLLKRKLHVDRDCTKKFLFTHLPVINLFRNYKLRENLFRDLVGGITVGVIQIAPSKPHIPN